MKNERFLVQLPEMASFWAVWLIMMGLAVAISSCKQPSFAGKGGGAKQPGNAEGRQATDNPPGGPGNPATPGQTPTPGSGVSVGDGSSTAATVPMDILYDSTESGSGGYEGAFVFSIKYPVSGEEKQIVTFNGGSKGKVTVPGACICGQKSGELDLIIQANGIKQNLAAWRQAVNTSSNPPATGHDWQKWLKGSGVKTFAGVNAAVYLGGFDHLFLSSIFGGDACGIFACESERKWNQRDDTRMIFVCHVDQCPNKEKDFQLKFMGQDP